MQAVLMMAEGGPEVLQLAEVPEPVAVQPSQLKIRLVAAGVNPVDTKLRSRGLFYPDALPAILGCDGAGIVVATGAAVQRFKVGDAVWFCNGGLGREPGNYADYTLVDEAVARAKPAALDFVAAAAAPLVLITAWEALFDQARLMAGQTVLIHGGTGGVGHVAIQLAKQAGARVITTVADSAKADLARGLGADEVILYPQQDFVTHTNALTHGKGADVVLDSVGDAIFRRSLECTAHYGTVVTLLDPGADVSWREARNRNLRIAFVLMLTPMLRDLPQARAHQGQILDSCGQWIAQGRLHIEIGAVLPLSQAAEAHHLIAGGHTQGKIVLRITEDPVHAYSINS
ncbi:MAG: zinc-binding dehydrogenase [Gammaproteobacteria bacterium]|nr:zinc-binding dehydrogenase [Gammaproteobacteria bacterium]